MWQYFARLYKNVTNLLICTESYNKYSHVAWDSHSAYAASPLLESFRDFCHSIASPCEHSPPSH